MDTASTVSADHATCSPNSSPSSVLERKRELKSIPGSFSYNLGRRDTASPPRLDTKRANGPCRSVKSIIAWIESSADNDPPSRLSTSTCTTTKSTNSSLHAQGHREEPQPRNTAGVNVDRDCPTFLDYQKYFTQSSLARCLDEAPKEESVEETQRERGGDAVAYNRAEDIECRPEVKTRSPEEVAAL